MAESEFLAIVARQAAGGVPNLNGPSGPPPPGVVPQLDNPPNGNHIAVPVMCVCTILIVILYSIRVWAKWQTKKLNMADYVSLVAFPLIVGYIYDNFLLAPKAGYMVDIWNMKLKTLPEYQKIVWVATLLYFTLVALVKTAILLEWVDIFVVDKRRSYFAWACYGTSATICCLSIILVTMDMVNCTPFKKNYNPLVEGHCRFDVPKFGLANAITNLVLDVIPVILAQNVIWKLNLSFAKKLGVSLAFFVGILGVGICVIRVIYAVRLYETSNETYYFSLLGLCSFCELTCAILILCAPSVPKAFVSFSQSKIVSKVGIRSSHNGSGNQSDAFHELSNNSSEKRVKPLRDPFDSTFDSMEEASSSSQEYLRRDSGRMV